MKMRSFGLWVSLLALATTACADDMMGSKSSAPGGDYAMVSSLVELPEFIPGLGTLYVQPATLPAGPFLAYDRNGQLVSSIYMIPLENMENQETFSDLEVGTPSVTEVDMYYNGGHPGVADPHYHIVLWHVDPQTAALE